MKRVRDLQWSGDRGEGSIFFFVDAETRQKVSRNLYLAYFAGGKEQLLSAKTDELDDAKRELRRLTRNRENAREGKETLITPKTERVTVGELLDANLRRAEEARLASLEDYTYRTETLKALLGSVRAVDLRPEHIDAYKARRCDGEGTRRKAKVGKTSIRRELEILQKAFRYGLERGVLRFTPFIEKPKVDNVRGQEIPLEQFPGILAALPCSDTRDFCEWLLLTATRPKGARALRWDWFDRQTWQLKIPSEKGGRAREFAIEGTLRKVIERRLVARRPGCALIFHKDGEALDARKVRALFYVALAACGLATGRAAGFTLYDTKKTAAGLLVDSGLSEAEAMAFSGHKTASMFQRYVIRNADRHRESVRRRDAYLEKRLSEKQSGDSERVAVFPKVSGE